MNVGIKIMPRDVILDTQGRAIEQSMKLNGFHLESVRAGKFIEISLPQMVQDQAQKEIEKMLQEGGLYNPLIEKYEVIWS